jgi:VWFA-related protein
MTRAVAVAVTLLMLFTRPQGPVTPGPTVWISATVADADGRLVTSLESDDFVVEDEGVAQKITVFSRKPLPFAAALMLDISRSTLPSLPVIRRGAELFLAQFIRGDRVNVGTFDWEVQVSARFTANRLRILGAVDLAVPDAAMPCIPPSFDGNLPRRRGGTAMWDAIDCGVQALLTDGEAVRRIVVILTDGKENVSYGKEKTTLERAGRAGVAVFPIYLPDPQGQNGEARKTMVRLAAETGGSVVPVDKRTDLPQAFATLGEELHHQYILGFVPSATSPGLRRLSVSVKKPGLTVRARTRYDIAGLMR